MQFKLIVLLNVIPKHILGELYMIKLGEIMNECKHWGCNLKNNTCIGCGNVICPICLQEPSDCRCENKDNCCKISD
jgi:hypothetical protein